jgi:hypothetical protein
MPALPAPYWRGNWPTKHSARRASPDLRRDSMRVQP